MRLSGRTAEIILVSLLGLVHFRVALAVLVLGRTGRIDQRCIDDGAPGAATGRGRPEPLMTARMPAASSCFSSKRRKLRMVVSSGMRSSAARQTGAGSWFRTALPPSLDRCSRTSSAADAHAASPSTGRPDGHLHPSDNVARSKQSSPSTAPPDPSRSGTTPCGFACACQRTRRRRRSSASSGNSVGGGAVFCQIRKSFSEFP